MVYKLSTSEWQKMVDKRISEEILTAYPNKPIKNIFTPMRPIADRVRAGGNRFVIMEANTTPATGFKRRGKLLALIELAEPAVLPTRIDKRLKSIRQIIAVREVFNLNHAKGFFIFRRYMNELHELLDKCERLWPCHFMIKGIDYVPPKTFMADENLPQTEG
jgi:hypothetical protein